MLGVVSNKTDGADLVRIEDFPSDAETAALRDALNDWWRSEVYPNSWRHRKAKKLG